MSTNAEVQILPTKNDVARKAAEEFVRAAAKSVQERGAFSVALAGGSTPLGMYELLAGEPYRSQVEWERVLFFWGDERCVPPDDPESNCGAAVAALVSELGLPEANVHRMRGEVDPHEAANAYEHEIRQVIGGQPPRFDLILLGMGDDGHTASLFPGTDALGETGRMVVANHVPKLDAWRLTFTSTLINAAHQVLFLVTGDGKAEALREVLEGEPDPDTYPSQLVRPTDGRLLFHLDEPAAALLTRS